MVLGDILPDREGVLYVRYLSSGMDYCVRAVAADSEQSQEHCRQKKDCNGFVKCFFQQTGRNCFLYSISSSALRLQYAYNI
jgi:hypothetical protein